MRYLYHITPRKGYESILCCGLRVNSTSKGFLTRKEYQKNLASKYGVLPIFMIGNVSVALKMLTREWVRSKSPVLLKIEVTGLTMLAGRFDTEWLSLVDIPPDRITYMRDIFVEEIENV